MFTVLSRRPHTMREMAPVRRMARGFSNMRSYRIKRNRRDIVSIPLI